MFENFETARVDVGPTTIGLRRAGAGPPLLLLHGFPETHVMWRSVAPRLAEQFPVVCADLRGYGSSGTTDIAFCGNRQTSRVLRADL
jgi:haloacetate dehalogenase